MFDALVTELSERYGLGDRSRLLFGLLLAYIHNDHRGGFTGFIEGFRQQGHGELVASWFGNADPGSMNVSDVGMIFGQGLLNDWGGRLGVSRATVAAAIAGVLPRLVAELTPGGHAPGARALEGHALEGHAPEGHAPEGHAPEERAPEGHALEGHAPERAPGERAPDRRFPSGRTLQASSTTAATTPAANGHNGLPEPDPADAVVRTAIASWERGQPGHRDPMPSPPAPPPAPQPAFPARSPVRTPVEARQARTTAPDPAEQRIAGMLAALDNHNPVPADPARPEAWRPATRAPHEPRRMRWLIWLVVMLAVLAAGGGFAWQQGLLAPYIQQYDLPVPASPGMA